MSKQKKEPGVDHQMADNKGYVHVYTGNGKGKSTAAFGLALRALMSGKRVFIGQFVKAMKYSETRIAAYFDDIEIVQYGKDCTVFRAPDEEDATLAVSGLVDIADKMRSGQYDLVILDEVAIAVYLKFLTSDEVWEAVQGRADHVEVILTGRKAPDQWIEGADLVTEMKEIKHYYQQGVLSREGIDC